MFETKLHSKPTQTEGSGSKLHEKLNCSSFNFCHAIIYSVQLCTRSIILSNRKEYTFALLQFTTINQSLKCEVFCLHSRCLIHLFTRLLRHYIPVLSKTRTKDQRKKHTHSQQLERMNGVHR